MDEGLKKNQKPQKTPRSKCFFDTFMDLQNYYRINEGFLNTQPKTLLQINTTRNLCPKQKLQTLCFLHQEGAVWGSIQDFFGLEGAIPALPPHQHIQSLPQRAPISHWDPSFVQEFVTVITSPLLAAQLDTSQKNKVFLKLSINQLAKEIQIFSCPSHWDGAARTRITRIFWGHPNSITFQKRCICLSQHTAFISYKISGFEAQFPS